MHRIELRERHISRHLTRRLGALEPPLDDALLVVIALGVDILQLVFSESSGRETVGAVDLRGK